MSAPISCASGRSFLHKTNPIVTDRDWRSPFRVAGGHVGESDEASNARNTTKVIDAFRQAAMNDRLRDGVDDLIQRFHVFGDRAPFGRGSV
jgi:hypothetical protein